MQATDNDNDFFVRISYDQSKNLQQSHYAAALYNDIQRLSKIYLGPNITGMGLYACCLGILGIFRVAL